MLHKWNFPSAYLEAFLDRNEECVETVGLVERLLLVDDDTLVEAADSMVSDVEWVGIGEEGQRIWIVNVSWASVSVRQWHQDIVNHVENLKSVRNSQWVSRIIDVSRSLGV